MKITYRYTEYPHSARATRASIQKGVCGGPTQIIVGLIAYAGGSRHDDFMIIGILGYLFIRVFRIFVRQKKLYMQLRIRSRTATKLLSTRQ